MSAAARKLQLVPTPVTAKAFREVYEEEFDFVWRVVRRLGIPERNCEDCVQDVFVRFHQKFAAWDQSRPVRALLGGRGLAT